MQTYGREVPSICHQFLKPGITAGKKEKEIACFDKVASDRNSSRELNTLERGEKNYRNDCTSGHYPLKWKTEETGLHNWIGNHGCAQMFTVNYLEQRLLKRAL